MSGSGNVSEPWPKRFWVNIRTRGSQASICVRMFVQFTSDVGSIPLRFLEMFRSAHFSDEALSQWMALTQLELVQAPEPGSTNDGCPAQEEAHSRSIARHFREVGCVSLKHRFEMGEARLRRQRVALAMSSWRVVAKELCIGLTSSFHQVTITGGHICLQEGSLCSCT